MGTRISARAGTNNVERCVFCDYWMGDADLRYENNNRWSYEQTVYGKCRANHDARARANGKCSKVCVNDQFL